METNFDKNCARAEMHYGRLIKMSEDPQMGLDTVRLLQMTAGIFVELFLEYDRPGEVMAVSADQLCKYLGVCPTSMQLPKKMHTPPFVIDKEIEFGREFAREIHLDNLDDLHIIREALLDLVAHDMILWEKEGFERSESLRLFMDAVKVGLSLEIASQEICDLVIAEMVGKNAWSLSECIIGLSGLAGRRMALSLDPLRDRLYNLCDMVNPFEQVAFIMTQEASRLGIPNDSDWKWKLAANDTQNTPPDHLISGVDPICTKFLNLIQLYYAPYRAAAVAKAAGRMIAVAAGGEMPELEPNVAKPLAMMAMRETFQAQQSQQFAS